MRRPATSVQRCLALLCIAPLFACGQHLSAAEPPKPKSGTHLLPRRPHPGKRLAYRQFTRSFEVGDALTVPAYRFRLGSQGHYQTTTTCRRVGQHCYIFVEDEVWNSPRVTHAGLDSVVHAFDEATARQESLGIFDVETRLFGPAPDVDGDPRILIVILDILDSPFTGSAFVGYFDTENQSPPVSREILYLDSDPLDLESTLAKATLAHELQHMLHWNSDPDEEKWVDEGCSEYAELVCGYKDTTQTAASAFLELTNTSLTVWKDLPFDFDQVFLFMTYYAQRYGEEAVAELVSEPKNGISGVEDVLERRGVPDRFEDLFAAWAGAAYLDGPDDFGFDRIDLGSVPRDTVDVPAESQTRNVQLWGVDYLALGRADGLSIQLTSESDLLAVLIAERDDSPMVASFSIPRDTPRRFASFGQEYRSLGISRTSGGTEAYTFTITPLEGTSPAASDFDANGRVWWKDFVKFAQHFDLAAGQPGYDPTYDLDGDRRVTFFDFLIFAKNFGRLTQ